MPTWVFRMTSPSGKAMIHAEFKDPVHSLKPGSGERLQVLHRVDTVLGSKAVSTQTLVKQALPRFLNYSHYVAQR